MAVACQQVDATTLTAPTKHGNSRPPPKDGDEPALSAPVELPALSDGARPAPFLRLPASASMLPGWSTAPVTPHLTFNIPVFVAEAPGTGRLFVIEREGRVFSVDVHAQSAEKRLVLDLSHVTQGHGDLGMLGLAFHPDFGRAGSPHAGSLFVHYAHSDQPQPAPIDVSAPSRWRLVRVELDTETWVADPASLTVLIEQDDEDTMHAGGSMFFHPSDGFLYVTVGDEGTGNCRLGNCQRIDRDLYGGVLRLDVDMRGGATSHPIPRQPKSGHFEIALDERRPEQKRRLETRLLVAAEEGRYYGLTYKWNQQSTDAVAVLEGEADVLEITGPDGVSREQTYVYPGPDDCLVCHNADAGHVLGVRTAQLNGDVRYGPEAPSSDQLSTWSDLGLLDVTLGPGSSSELSSLAPLTDETRSIQDRVRSYWDSNCSMCHGVVHGLRATWDARYDTPLSEQGVIGAAPFNADAPDFSMIVAPGDPEGSLLYQRDRSVAFGERMPPLGRTRPDEAYLRLLERWILAL